jgi:hypothetical protein
MIERDYLMRQIQQLVAAVIRALSSAFDLQGEGRSEEALEVLDRVQREAFPAAGSGFDPEDLREACSRGGRLEPEIGIALADILRMRCTLLADLGWLQDAASSGAAALDLYRRAASVPGGVVPADLHDRIRSLEDTLANLES